jgi:chromosome partitioning protein
MQRIVVLNPKGGSGKTTVATNLASYFAGRGDKTVLMDYDSQGSSTFWASQRGPQHPPVQVISAFKQPLGVTRSWFLRVPPQTRTLVIDTPAALEFGGYQRVLQEAAAIVIPVLPADIDIHAAAKCIADLLTTTKISREEGRIAVVANRARKNTLVYQRLVYFLNSLRIPFLTTLRDTQNYINAAANGLGIFDMQGPQVQEDLVAWQPLLAWLEKRESIDRQLLRDSGMRPMPMQQNRVGL